MSAAVWCRYYRSSDREGSLQTHFYAFFFQFIADHVETNALFREEKECQALIMEALKYHLLPERRSSFQSPRTKPRKSTVGLMYAVGGIDCNKGRSPLNFFVNVIASHFLTKTTLALSKLMTCYIKDEVHFLKKKKELCYLSVWEKP